MASSERRGFYRRNGVWWVRTDPITRRAKSTRCRDFEAARSWRAERERIASNPSNAAALAATLSDWVARFVAMKQRDSSEATVLFYRDKLGHYIRVWGEGCRLITIDANKVDAFVTLRREEGVSEQTISKEVAALVQVLKLAKRARCYAEDLDTLRPPDLHGTSVARSRALTRDELAAMRSKASPRASALAAVCVALGCRRSEAGRLQPGDIDLETGRAFIRGTKTDEAERWVPVLSMFRPLLEEALPLLPLGEDLAPLNWELRKACLAAGIPHASPNDLRRTHATWLVEAGVDGDVIRRLMGHTTRRLVDQVYGRPSPEALGALAEARLKNVTGPEKTGVTDGDRTRDNRSHKPNRCSEPLENCNGNPGFVVLRTGGRRWLRLVADQSALQGIWLGRRGRAVA